MHSFHNGRSPAYLRDTVHTIDSNTQRSRLRSAATARYFIRRCGVLGERAFSVAGPHTWNGLPSKLHAVTDFKVLKKLKTHYFKMTLKQLL